MSDCGCCMGGSRGEPTPDDCLMFKIERLELEVTVWKQASDLKAQEIEPLREALIKTKCEVAEEHFAEVERLRDQIASLDSSLSGACKTIKERCVEIERLKYALIFYADKTNYVQRGWQGERLVNEDRGKTARRALEEKT